MLCLKKVDSKCRSISKEFQGNDWRIDWSPRKREYNNRRKEIYVFFSLFNLWKSTKLQKRVFLLFLRRLPKVLVSLILKFCDSNWLCDFEFVYHPYDIYESPREFYEFSRRRFRRFDFITEWESKVELFHLFRTDLKPILLSLHKSVWFPVSSVSCQINTITIRNTNNGTQQSLSLVGAVRWPNHFFAAWKVLFAKHTSLTAILWNRISNAKFLVQPNFQVVTIESNLDSYCF